MGRTVNSVAQQRAAPHLRPRSSVERRQDLGMLREAAFPLLGEDEPPLAEHVELAGRAGPRRGIDPPLMQRGRETRSPRVVAASDRAVDDFHLHGRKRCTRARPLQYGSPSGASGACGACEEASYRSADTRNAAEVESERGLSFTQRTTWRSMRCRLFLSSDIVPRFFNS